MNPSSKVTILQDNQVKIKGRVNRVLSEVIDIDILKEKAELDPQKEVVVEVYGYDALETYIGHTENYIPNMLMKIRLNQFIRKRNLLEELWIPSEIHTEIRLLQADTRFIPLHHKGIEVEILEVGTRGLKVRTTEAIPENTTLFLNLPIGDEFCYCSLRIERPNYQGDNHVILAYHEMDNKTLERIRHELYAIENRQAIENANAADEVKEYDTNIIENNEVSLAIEETPFDNMEVVNNEQEVVSFIPEQHNPVVSEKTHDLGVEANDTGYINEPVANTGPQMVIIPELEALIRGNAQENMNQVPENTPDNNHEVATVEEPMQETSIESNNFNIPLFSEIKNDSFTLQETNEKVEPEQENLKPISNPQKEETKPTNTGPENMEMEQDKVKMKKNRRKWFGNKK